MRALLCAFTAVGAAAAGSQCKAGQVQVLTWGKSDSGCSDGSSHTDCYDNGACQSCGHSCHYVWSCDDSGMPIVWAVHSGSDCSSKEVAQKFVPGVCTHYTKYGNNKYQIAYCPTAPPPPPTPGYNCLQQYQCEDDSCSLNCQRAVFPLYECVGDSDGSSSIITTCDPKATPPEAELHFAAAQCHGQGMPIQNPLGRCIISSGGGSFLDSCDVMPAATLAAHLNATTPSLRRRAA